MADGFDKILAMGVATAFEVRGNRIQAAAHLVPEGTINTLREAGGLGELVASAVSLGFAIEIYLKTLLRGFGVVTPRVHALRELFSLLPDPAKRLAATIYLQHTSARPLERGAITLATGKQEVPTWWPSLEAPSDIEAAIERIGDVVVGWRYPFEISVPRDADHQLRHLDYGSLIACCNVFGRMCEILVLETDQVDSDRSNEPDLASQT